MELLIYTLLILSFGLIILGVTSSPEVNVSGYKLPHDQTELKRVKMHFALARLSPINQKLLERLGLYSGIKNRLSAARSFLSPLEFVNIKLLTMAVFFIISVFIFAKATFAGVFGAIILGYVFPDIWLNEKIKRRKNEIVRVLPETVDLLGLCVEAGLDFTMSVKWVIEKTAGNPMIEELRFVLEEIKWGKSRGQALKDMSKRLNIPEISSFVQTLVQAERMGTSVAEAFLILSEDSRMRRFQRGERFALKAPLKILIPLIFCILPVIAIVIGGPIMLQFSKTKLF